MKEVVKTRKDFLSRANFAHTYTLMKIYRIFLLHENEMVLTTVNFYEVKLFLTRIRKNILQFKQKFFL